MEIDRELLLRTFRAETDENLRAASEALLALDADDLEPVNVIFRAVHTLKGDASSLGLGAAAALAHALEGLLEAVRSGALPPTPAVVAFVRQGLESVAATLEGEASVEGGERLGLAGPETVRVRTDRLDRLLGLAGEAAVARERLRQLVGAQGAKVAAQLGDVVSELERAQSETHAEVLGLRTVPIGPLLHGAARCGRDLCSKLGKVADIDIEGEQVEVDLRFVEQVRGPLLHLVRNAVDHGLEGPEARRAAGKAARGQITIRASAEGGAIVLEIEDDGAGLSKAKILERAHRTGIDRPESLSEQDLFQLVFRPGFSTASAVTEVSGRGVGLDAARKAVEALRGAVTIASREGQGTRVSLRLPLTVAIIDGFSVGVGDETFVLPLSSVVECVDAAEGLRWSDERCGVLGLRGEPLPCLRLGAVLPSGPERSGRKAVVVVEHALGRAGLVVDELLGSHPTVLRPLSGGLERVPCVAGAAVLGTGRVALVIDVPSLLSTEALTLPLAMASKGSAP